MSTLLYRLGKFAYRRRWWVLLSWVALLGVTIIGSATLAGETEDNFELPGSESVEAMELMDERFPGDGGLGVTARVVFVAPEGESLLADQTYQAAVAGAVDQMSQLPDAEATGPIPSPQDDRFALAQVEYADFPENAEEDLTGAVAAAQDAGLTVEMGGDALAAAGPPEGFESELIGLAVAALVLIITFGSFAAAGMPLLNAIIGIGTSLAAIAVASRFFDLGTSTPILASMLGLALAVDYSLFIVSRARHEIAIGRSGEEAAGRALGTAGAAVVFAGLTVVVALCGLVVVGMPMLTQMGFAAAFAVAMAVLIALTMLPALCGFAGKRIAGGRIPGLRSRDPEADGAKAGIAGRWAKLVTRYPAPILLVVGLVMMAVAAPALSLRLGFPDDGSLDEGTTQRQAYDLIAEGFGEGFNGPLLLVVDTAGAGDAEAAGTQVAAAVQGIPGVAFVDPEVQVNPARDTAVVTVLPETGPSSAETEDLVTAIRDQTGALEEATGAQIGVTGLTAIVIDFSEKMGESLLPYLALIAGVSFLLLMLVFRSLLVPLKAALGFLLSMAATFGALVAVFQWGWLDGLLNQTGLVISFLPIILIGIVFGLAMDYQVFLVTRMREEYVHGAAPKAAVVTGFRHGSRVVTAAAIIMISVFASFALSGDDFIVQIAFALAVAIVFDALLIRMTLVPAALALLGRAAWWLPGWLSRLLPVVDVEGEKLRRTLEPDPAAPELATSPTN